MKLKIGSGFTKVRFTVKNMILKDDWSGSGLYPNILETR